VHARQGNERALEVLAVAHLVRHAGLITSPPREIPFWRFFFQKSLAVMAQQTGGQLQIPVPSVPATTGQTGGSGLVLSPHQLAAVEAGDNVLEAKRQSGGT